MLKRLNSKLFTNRKYKHHNYLILKKKNLYSRRITHWGTGLLLKSATCKDCKFFISSGMSGISEIKLRIL